MLDFQPSLAQATHAGTTRFMNMLSAFTQRRIRVGVLVLGPTFMSFPLQVALVKAQDVLRKTCVSALFLVASKMDPNLTDTPPCPALPDQSRKRQHYPVYRYNIYFKPEVSQGCYRAILGSKFVV